MLTFGSLFSGIGGMDLGLERAGMKCLWQVEIDDWCNRVLAKHWPEVRRYKDVKEVHGVLAHANGFGYKENVGKTLSGRREAQTSNSKLSGGSIGRNPILRTGEEEKYVLEPVDLICGGFPCQPHSVAGKRKGADDDRNLWPEYLRIITELQPRYILGENVPGIITTYLDTVLSDLEGAGYITATFNIPACAFDAPHRRERIFIVAHSVNIRQRNKGFGKPEEGAGQYGYCRNSQNVSNRGNRANQMERCKDVAYANANGNGKHSKEYQRRNQLEKATGKRTPGRNNEIHNGQWTIEPDVGRVAHGIPNRVDRLRGLGNAVVPQVAEWIGKRIIEFDRSET